MFSKITAMALALALPLSIVAQGDFAWEVEPLDGYPTVEFSDEAADGEIVFKYGYEGTLSAQKFLTYEFLQYDCLEKGDDAILVANVVDSVPQFLDFDADIDFGLISDSIYYTDINATFAAIAFCTRVDYNYINLLGETESINFHETKMTITVDRTAGFEIAAVDIIRVNATETDTNAELDYDVTAYFCDDLNNAETPNPYAQGSAMQVCVKIDDSVTTEDIYVEDILSFTVSQPLGPASPSVAILNSLTDLLTAKACGLDGICNVKTQLQSKFFVDLAPNPLRVDGTAILAFGDPSSPSARKLKVKIQGYVDGNDQHSERSLAAVRKLQGAETPFELEAPLQGSSILVEEEVAAIEGATIAIILVVLILLIGGGFAMYYFMFGAGSRREQEKEIHVQHGMHAQPYYDQGGRRSRDDVC